MRDSWGEQAKMIIPKWPRIKGNGGIGDGVVEFEDGSPKTRTENGARFEVLGANGDVCIQ